jgi:hypothetical protein
MLKKRVSHLMALLFMMILAFALAGCDTLIGEEGETWRYIASLDDLHGTWLGIFTQTMTLREYVENVQGLEWTSEAAALYRDIMLVMRVDQTTTIDAQERIGLRSQFDTYIFTGGNIVTAWPELKERNYNRPGVSVMFSDSSYTILISQNRPPVMVSVSTFADSQISYDGTKWKIPAGFYWEGSPEVIFTKRDI